MTERLRTAAIRLADVLTRENAALAALELPRAAAMLAEKRTATQAFTDLSAAAHTVTADDRGRLAGPVRQLRALAAENKALLERALAVQSRIVGVVAGAIRAMPGPPRYRSTGEMAAAARPVAFTLSARV